MANKKRNSILLVTILLVISCIAIWFVYQTKMNSTKVLVTVNGSYYGEYSLNKNQKINVEIDKNINIIEIKDKAVEVISANCDNQICVHTPAISKQFPSLIVCLPHGVVIELID